MGEVATTCAQTFSALGKIWTFRDYNEREAMRISQVYGLSEITARLLSSRGQTADTTQSFLNPTIREFLPDPSHLLDVDKGVARIFKAIQNKEKIAIFGDYDVDGATSSASLSRFLEQVYEAPLIYIPDRSKEGYGPNLPALLSLKEQGVDVVITVDCGITAYEPLEEATKAGLDIIVIDHHAAEPQLPKVEAVINPNRLDQESECGSLAAVGVCFLFIVALNRLLRTEEFYKDIKEPDLLSFLDLVALGTVCDVVSLSGLNRAFVSQGLKVMGQRQNLGLKTMLDQAGLDVKPTPYHLGFVLGPRINAGGRVGESSMGSKLLTTHDIFEAQNLSQKLDQYNEARREIEAQVLGEAETQSESQKEGFIFVGGENWHPGVIGIVAGRIKDKFHRPTAVVAFENGLGKASARSIHGFDLGATIHAAQQKGLLVTGGGHPMAGGFTIEADKVEAFKAFMNDRLEGVDLAPVLKLDGEISLGAVTVDFINSLEQVGPYGSGNPTPKFVISDARLSFVDQVGENHLRCTLQNLEGYSLTAMAFRSLGTPLGDALLNSKGKTIEVAGTLNINSWCGQEKPQVLIEDVRV